MTVILASCATAPANQEASSSRSNVSAPDWTTRTTFMEGSSLVFVVAGPATATIADLAYQAMASYLDLPIVPTTPLVAAQAVQKFLTGMSSTAPSDHYVKNGQGYWKVAVSKEAWDAARVQLKALLDQSSGDPSVALERAADELLRQGKYVEAVSAYVATASSALTDGHSVPRFRSNVAKAVDILDSMTLTSATPALVTRVGDPFTSPLDVKVSFGPGAQAPVVPGVPLRFNYKAKKNGRIAVTGQTVKTDSQGHVRFDLPTPDFAVRDSVVVLVDVTSWLEALASVPKEQRDVVATLESGSAGQRLQLPYTVESAAKQIPMIVALADFDDRGSVQRRQESSAAVITALQKEGFQASGLPVNPTLLKSTNENVVLAAWKFQGKTTGRAVYGTVNLVSVTSSGAQYSAEVTGTLKVADLGTNKGIYQATTSRVAVAGDKASAVSQAYRLWSTDAVSALALELP